MEQLIISLSCSHAINELERKDFLAESEHSPQWLGNYRDWEIRDMSLILDKNGKIVMTALLENKSWTAPEIPPITGEKLFDIIKRYPGDKVKVGFRKGIYGELFEKEYAGYERMFLDDNGYNTLLCNTSSFRPNNKCLNLYEHIGFTMENEDRVVTNEQAEKERAEMPLAIRIPGQDYAHPVSEVIYGSDSVTLIYVQDVNI